MHSFLLRKQFLALAVILFAEIDAFRVSGGSRDVQQFNSFSKKSLCEYNDPDNAKYSRGIQFRLKLSTAPGGKNDIINQHYSIHHDYIRDPTDEIEDEGKVDLEAIQDMLQIREKATHRKDYGLADEILAELWKDHGVVVLEKEQKWTTRFSADGKVSHDYHRDPNDLGEGEVDLKAVTDMLSIRDKALRKRDFQLADEMRDELLEEHGVHVDDCMRLWSTNPLFKS